MWKNINIYIYIVCVLTWSLLGFHKNLGPCPDRSPLGVNSKFPTSIHTPFICGVAPPPRPPGISCQVLPSHYSLQTKTIIVWVELGYTAPLCFLKKQFLGNSIMTYSFCRWTSPAVLEPFISWMGKSENNTIIYKSCLNPAFLKDRCKGNCSICCNSGLIIGLIEADKYVFA